MTQLTHVFVTVPEGRIVPMPANEAPGVGDEQHRCHPGKVYVVPWTRYARGRIAVGDFVLSNKGGTAVKSTEEARAEATIKLDHDYTVATDQRSDVEINEAAAKAEAAKNAKPMQATRKEI